MCDQSTQKAIFPGDGKMHALIRTHEWSSSPLGHPCTWPQPLHAIAQSILDCNFPMFVAWGPQLSLIYNAANIPILGEKHPAALGRPMHEVWEEIWPQVSPIIERALAGESSYFQNFYTKISRNGRLEQAWFTFSHSPIRNDAEDVVGILCVLTETTDHVLADIQRSARLDLIGQLRDITDSNEIISTASRLLGQYLGASRVCYVDFDDSARVFYIVRDWTDNTLQSLSGIAGNLDDCDDALINDARTGHPCAINDIATDRRTMSRMEAYGTIGVGSLLHIPVVRNGKLISGISIHRTMPYEWTRADIALAEDIAEHTWAAVERARAIESLRRADRCKDEFLAMLAHELRNPLAPICSAANLLGREHLDPDRIRATGNIISRQVRHMTGLIDDLLDVSRVTRGLITLDKQQVDMKQVVSDAVEQVRPLIETRHQNLTVHTSVESEFVLADKTRLIQILANLLNNAAKYTPAGGDIAVRMEVIDGKVVLTVTDNGIGMDQDLIPHVFVLYAQAQRVSDRAHGGLGLGLAIVKSLVDLHCGNVSAHSEGHGKGSTFCVQLPRLSPRTDGT